MKHVITQQEMGIPKLEYTEEYDRYLEICKPGPIIPGLKEELIPQGMSYCKSMHWMILSYYCKTGTSALAIIDLKTDKLVKSIRMVHIDGTDYAGHAGGVAVSEKHVWVSSERKVRALKLDEVIGCEDGARLSFVHEIPIETKSSYASYADGVLWVGEYAHARYWTKESHHMPNRKDEPHCGWVTGYRLDPVTDILMNESYNEEGEIRPDYILSIRNEIQGMISLPDKMILSRSAGRTIASSIYSYDQVLNETPHRYIELGGKEIPLWYLDGLNQRDEVLVPPMSEGIAAIGDSLYISFESAAIPYLPEVNFPLDRLQILDLKQLK